MNASVNPFVSWRTRLSASELNATIRPSADTVGLQLSPLAGWLPSPTEICHVWCRYRSRSHTLLVGPRGLYAVAKATNRPSADSDGESTFRIGRPWLSTEASRVAPVQRLRT